MSANPRSLVCDLDDSYPATPERLYLFDTGALYISRSVARAIKRPHMATIVLALAGDTFRFSDDDQWRRAAVIKPRVGHALATPGPVVSVLVAPSHPHFRAFAGFDVPVAPLARHAFYHLDVVLEQVRRGKLSFAEAERLFVDIVASAVVLLPAPPVLDVRVERAVALLGGNLECPLDVLARATHLSYHRLSHLFSENVGLPLRSYRAWARMHHACRLLSEGCRQADIVRRAGFTDVSHFSNVCRRSFGVPPTVFRSHDVQIISRDGDATTSKVEVDPVGPSRKDSN